MENYEKGEVVAVPDDTPTPWGDDVLEMKVQHGSKVRNLMGFAVRKFKDETVRQIVWSGSDKAISKTVTCAEILKRKFKNIHQITKIRYKIVEEIWEPKMEGLDRLKVKRQIPAISILLSKDALDKDEQGYQAPGTYDSLWNPASQQTRSKPGKKRGPPSNARGGGQKSKSPKPDGTPSSKKQGGRGQGRGGDRDRQQGKVQDRGQQKN
ncbi:ribonuclease P protein subunit p25-like protein [Branchiostoma floridae x Branchiostoma belcheri]